MNITLYSIQAPGVDLTAQREPGFEYAHPEGCYYDMAKYLGWPWWVWCFPSLDDFDCPPAMEPGWAEKHPGDRWTLQVPAEAVRWCGVNALCFGTGALEECFHSTADACRVAVNTPEGKVIDTPQGLVRGPIKAEWVVERVPVGTPLGAVAANVVCSGVEVVGIGRDTLDRVDCGGSRLVGFDRAF